MRYMFIFLILKLGIYIHIFLKEQFSLMKEHVQMKDRYPWNIIHHHIYRLICMYIRVAFFTRNFTNMTKTTILASFDRCFYAC